MAGAVLLAAWSGLRTARTLDLLERRPGLLRRRAGDVLRALRSRLVHHRLVRPMARLVHGRLGMLLGRLMVRRGLRLVMVGAGVMDRRLGMRLVRLMIDRRLGRGRRLEVVMLGGRRRRWAIVMLVRRGRRRSYVMDHRGIIIDQINVFGRDDAADKGKGHHTGDAGGNEAHRASFYKVVAFVSLG